MLFKNYQVKELPPILLMKLLLLILVGSLERLLKSYCQDLFSLLQMAFVVKSRKILQPPVLIGLLIKANAGPVKIWQFALHFPLARPLLNQEITPVCYLW